MTTTTTTVAEMISKTDLSRAEVTLNCRLIGTIDGAFSLMSCEDKEYAPERSIPVLIDGLLRMLGKAGLQPRGGGLFPYGGKAIIRGTIEPSVEMNGRLCLVDFESIEVEVHRRGPIRLTKKDCEV